MEPDYAGIKRTLKLVALSVVLMYAIAVGIGLYHHAQLCSFKHDLERRAQNGQEFLAMSKKERVEQFGPGFGRLNDDALKVTLANQQDTLDSLRWLYCPR